MERTISIGRRRPTRRLPAASERTHSFNRQHPPPRRLSRPHPRLLIERVQPCAPTLALPGLPPSLQQKHPANRREWSRVDPVVRTCTYRGARGDGGGGRVTCCGRPAGNPPAAPASSSSISASQLVKTEPAAIRAVRNRSERQSPGATARESARVRESVRARERKSERAKDHEITRARERERVLSFARPCWSADERERGAQQAATVGQL